MKASHRYHLHRTAISAALLLLTACSSIPSLGDEWRWSGVERVVAITDVHGAIDAMTATLQKAGVLDETAAWSGGPTHLVITGDILDRGAESRKVMDLIMRLESEATAAGGRVHLLLGNHEVMNLVGDLRYVSEGEYAAFAGEEDAADRERWFLAYLAKQEEGADEAALRAEYDKKFPPGFFGLRRAFATDGVYGSWLLSKPLLIVINRTAFVHGGLSPLATELGLDGVNAMVNSEVRDYISQTEVLNEAGILDPTENFFRHATLLEAIPETVEHPESIKAAIESVIGLNGSNIHDVSSPLWYRGAVGCPAVIEDPKLAAALNAIDADRVVIGHTPTQTRQVQQRLDARVIEIDTGMLKSYYEGSGNALVIEGGAISVIGQLQSSADAPIPQPRRVGPRSDDLGADKLAQALAEGEIKSLITTEAGITTVDIAYGGDNISAVFRENRRKNFLPDLAAYRLDRLLALDMVPVTAAREVDGKKGSLQFLPKKTLNEQERQASRRGAGAWCPLSEQWQAMYVFDSLIRNDSRLPTTMRYSVDNWQLIITDYRDAFSTKRGLAPYVANWEKQTGTPLAIGDGWRKALTALTDEQIATHLGDVLDKRRLKALGKRRDELLERE